MTKNEFEESTEPLVYMLSVNPETGKCLHDSYPYNQLEFWLGEMERDFPEYITGFLINKAAIDQRMFELNDE